MALQVGDFVCPSYMKLLTSISWEHPSLVLLGFMLVPDPSPRDLAFSCAGVEYHERGRCELWNRSIESSLTLMGSGCGGLLAGRLPFSSGACSIKRSQYLISVGLRDAVGSEDGKKMEDQHPTRLNNL